MHGHRAPSQSREGIRTPQGRVLLRGQRLLRRARRLVRRGLHCILEIRGRRIREREYLRTRELQDH